MASTDLKPLAEFQEFKDRVEINLVYTAGQIVGEAATTPYSEKRQAYGVAILRNPNSFVKDFCSSLVVQSAINSTISIDDTDPDNPILDYSGSQVPVGQFDSMDIEIQNTLSAIYNDLAGVTTA